MQAVGALDLAHVERALVVDPDVVRRGELAWTGAGFAQVGDAESELLEVRCQGTWD